jgi:hypothetical protein
VQAQRQAFDQKMARVDPAHLGFVDETGATTALDRPYGRAPAGTRVEASTPGRMAECDADCGPAAHGGRGTPRLPQRDRP